MMSGKDFQKLFFSKDGWSSSDDLLDWGDRTGLATTVRLLGEGRIFFVMLPFGLADYNIKFYHRLTPQLARTMGLAGWSAVTINEMALPSGLVRTFARKIPRTMLRRRRAFGRDNLAEAQVRLLVRMLNASVPVTARLEHEGLFADRPRPSDGFMYPCRWKIESYPDTFPRSFVFNIRFTGTIKNIMAPHLLYSKSNVPFTAYHSPENGCTVTIDETEATISISRVARVTFNRQTRIVEDFPSRDELVQDTADIIRACAPEPAVLPFVTLGKPEPFQLITPNSHASREADREENCL